VRPRAARPSDALSFAERRAAILLSPVVFIRVIRVAFVSIRDCSFTHLTIHSSGLLSSVPGDHL